jgi:opacity protein-like surface antigen
MKKLLCAALLTLLAAGPAAAQQDQGVRIGLTANPVFGWFKTQRSDQAIDAVKNDGLKVGFSYGAMGEYQFADNYAVEFRLQHLLYSGEYEVNRQNGGSSGDLLTRDWNLQYLEIPVNMKMKTNEIGYFTFFGKFGLSPAFRLQATAAEQKLIDENGSQPIEQSEIANSSQSKFMNMTVNFGLGAMYHLGGDTYLNGGLTFHNGVIKANDDDAYGVKPAYISLDLGVLF